MGVERGDVPEDEPGQHGDRNDRGDSRSGEETQSGEEHEITEVVRMREKRKWPAV